MRSEVPKIIIVEDEPSLVFTLRDTLENEGYKLFVAKKGEQAISIVENEDIDLMILDLMLPEMSGYDVCRQIREGGFTFPVIILTARDQENDKVTGLNMGADDYMTKPFGVKELLARIEAQLRRSSEYSGNGLEAEFDLDPVHIDLKSNITHKPNDETCRLSTREVQLIQYFIKHLNEPISRDELLREVWQYDFSTNTRTVDVHISKLRSKIEVKPDEPQYLVTLHGVGYMLKVN